MMQTITIAGITLNLTAHYSNDRVARVQVIEQNVGFGYPVISHKEIDEQGREYERILTSTGVIIVRGTARNTLVTVFIARMGQAVRAYNANNQRITQAMREVITRNMYYKEMSERV